MTSRRSDCPISFALELFGDRWTLLVVRDLAFKAKHTFGELLASEEGIATNILAERLTRLEDRGLVVKARDPHDGRRFRYALSDAGKELLPILVELIVWSAKHDDATAAPESFVRAATKSRGALLRRLRADISRQADNQK